jgi:hypothetical protein
LVLRKIVKFINVHIALSGVAGSYDVYAQAPGDPNDGFCELAIGLGGTVVGGEYPCRWKEFMSNSY